jgi:hypothetical protein
MIHTSHGYAFTWCRVPVPASQIVHIAVEMAPIAKVGGMGDVVTALGRAVQEEGHQVEVILPKFDCINYDLVQVGGQRRQKWAHIHNIRGSSCQLMCHGLLQLQHMNPKSLHLNPCTSLQKLHI